MLNIFYNLTIVKRNNGDIKMLKESHYHGPFTLIWKKIYIGVYLTRCHLMNITEQVHYEIEEKMISLDDFQVGKFW